MSEQGIVACGNCQVAMQGPEGDDPQDVFSCPECGRSDTREKVIEEVKAYVTDTAARGLQDQMKSMASKSRIMTYTEKQSFPEREYRYIWISQPAS